MNNSFYQELLKKAVYKNEVMSKQLSLLKSAMRTLASGDLRYMSDNGKPVTIEEYARVILKGAEDYER